MFRTAKVAKNVETQYGDTLGNQESDPCGNGVRQGGVTSQLKCLFTARNNARISGLQWSTSRLGDLSLPVPECEPTEPEFRVNWFDGTEDTLTPPKTCLP